MGFRLLLGSSLLLTALSLSGCRQPQPVPPPPPNQPISSEPPPPAPEAAEAPSGDEPASPSTSPDIDER